jgi:hypothetical protein
LCGFAFWQKYNFVAFIPLLLTGPFLDLKALAYRPPRLALSISFRDWVSRTKFVAAGFASVVVAVMAWILLIGAWPAMRESQFEVLPRYAAMGIAHNPHYLLSAFVLSYFLLGPATVFVTLAALTIGWLTRDLKRLLAIFLVAATALASTMMQLRCHDYYYQICYPFFAVLWGYLAVKLYETAQALTNLLKKQNRRLAATLVWVLIANVFFWPIPTQISSLSLHYAQLLRWREDPQTFYANYPQQLPMELLKGQLEVVRYIQKNTTPSDPIYLWGSNSLIYFVTGHQAPTRFILNLGVVAQWGQASWKQEIMQAIEQSQPRLIIVTRGDAVPTITYEDMDSEEFLHNKFLVLDNYITQNYKKTAEFERFVIYQRKPKTTPIMANYISSAFLPDRH